MRTILAIAVVSCLAAGPAAAQGQEAKEGTIYKAGNGVSAPVVVKEVKPQYTPDAMRARVQGTVPLDCVIEIDGRVGDVKVTKSLDPGLDKEAIKAVKLWRFEPGTKDGKPVRVQVSLELTFTLRDPPAQPLINAGPPATGKVADAGQANGVPIYKPGNGVTPPRLLKDVKPQYTREAKDAKIQGIVYLDGVVETDGSVGDVVVTRSLDAGLDEEAIKAVKQWKFEPGTKDGKPVRVQVSFEMTFTPR